MDNDYKALLTLVERESYWLCERIKSFDNRKYAIFPAGPTGQDFYYSLLNDFGIEAEFFIDNNPALEGNTTCGKPIVRNPWDNIANFADEYVVLIPTAERFFFQIARQLEAAGIYFYMHASAYWVSQNFLRYKSVVGLLDDELSKLSYLGAVYSLLTCDNSFIQYNPNQYFAIREFAECCFQTVVDAGAYVGDTVEEYVKRGIEGLKIYAFEPFLKARKALERRRTRLIEEFALNEDDIVIVPAGVGEKTEHIAFSEEGNKTLRSHEGGSIELPIHSIDDFFKDKAPFTILKADVEGSEMDMLKGAANTIMQFKPKMALSIYHSSKDFVQIIEYVRSLVPEYKFMIRNHFSDFRDTVLYCYVREGHDEGGI